MDRLYEQLRVRYVNSEKKDRESNSTREGQTPPKKTVSFDAEKKVSWFPKQLSRQMSEVDEPRDYEFATAVAAATYAVDSLEERRNVQANGLQSPLAKTMSKKENSIVKKTDSDKLSRWFSGSKKFAEEQGKISGQSAASMVKTPTLRTGSGKLNLTNFGHTDTKADAWEKAELTKVQKRYEKMYSSIVEWESKKKTKAKRQLEQNETELQLERAKALQEYNEEVERINKIAAGARTVADKKKKKDESKIKKKANKIRSTGDVPRSCFFF